MLLVFQARIRVRSRQLVHIARIDQGDPPQFPPDHVFFPRENLRHRRLNARLTLPPRDGALLLTLGRLCRQQQLWGKARSYLEAALGVAPSRAAHVELAQLLDQLEESALAVRHYRAAAVL